MSVRRETRRDPRTGKMHEHWLIDVDIKHPDGRRERIRKISPVQSRRGAEQYERELRQSLLDGTYGRKEEPAKAPVVIPTVADFAKEFLETYVIVNNKPSEQETKRIILRQHIVPRLGKLKLDEVGPQMEPFKAKLLTTGISRKRVNNILAVLSKMLRYAEEREVLPRAPRLRLLKLPPTSHDYFTFEEYAALVKAAEKWPEWRVAILLGGDAGLRMGEMIALARSDVDFLSGNLTVRRSSWHGIVGTTKGGRERVVPITKRLQAALEAHSSTRGTLVLSEKDGSPITADAMKRPLWNACDAAGLRRTGWHVLRHTFCSHLAMRGAAPVAIQALAGHESSQTTNRYMHLAPMMLRETVRLLDCGDETEQGGMEENTPPSASGYGVGTAREQKAETETGKPSESLLN